MRVVVALGGNALLERDELVGTDITDVIATSLAFAARANVDDGGSKRALNAALVEAREQTTALSHELVTLEDPSTLLAAGSVAAAPLPLVFLSFLLRLIYIY